MSGAKIKGMLEESKVSEAEITAVSSKSGLH